MPVVLWWGISAAAAGLGFKLLGDGIEDSTKGARDLLLAAAVVGAVYLVAKKQGVL